MATKLQSRFSVLSIDDEEPKSKKSLESSTAILTVRKTKKDTQKSQATTKDDKKKPKKKNISGTGTQQWEQWKLKDSMAVDTTYQQELHEAILQSKLTFEAQLENIVQYNDSTERAGAKKYKKLVMSLEEFNNLGNNEPKLASDNCDRQKSRIEVFDDGFFERVSRQTKEEIIKSKEEDSLKSRLHILDEDITSAQLRAEVEKKNNEISSLKDELAGLKQELSQVKARNKKLYSMLAHGEMYDKASLLVEVTKLNEIQGELTSEMTFLHAQLEQERSKNLKPSSTDVKTFKQSNKKRPASFIAKP